MAHFICFFVVFSELASAITFKSLRQVHDILSLEFQFSQDIFSIFCFSSANIFFFSNLCCTNYPKYCDQSLQLAGLNLLCQIPAPLFLSAMSKTPGSISSNSRSDSIVSNTCSSFFSTTIILSATRLL